MRRQILTVFSAVTIVSLLFPAIAFAEDYTWSDNGDGTCEITGYTGPGGAVTIPSVLGGLTVTAIGDSAFYRNYSLTSVTIPGSVTTIGDYSFQYCGYMISVTIPESIISIGDHAFFMCGRMISVNIPDSVTTIGDHAFDGCTSLTSVLIPDSVTNIGLRTFDRCSDLTAITVDSLNPAYSSIAGVLFNKTQTLIIKYPDGKTGTYAIPDGVTIVEEFAFYRSAVTSVNIPDSVASIGVYAFDGSGLTSGVIIPASVTTIGRRAFDRCSDLTAINVDALNPNYSTIAGVLFNKTQTLLIKCPGGKSGTYTLPDTVTSVEDFAFFASLSLTSINIPDSVTSIGYAGLSWCDSLTSITIPDSVTSLGDSVFAWSNNLTSITIGNNVATIGDRAFFRCTNLAGVYFRGDPPVLGWDPFSYVDNARVYYLSSAVGWGATYGGLPATLWLQLPVDMEEFALLASFWQMTGCDEMQPCSATDWYIDGTIDMLDLKQLAISWLGDEIITYCPISNHVFEIEMSLSYDFGVGYGSSVPVDYQFDAWMWVDGTVVSGTVETPGGVVYPAEMHEDGENWLGVGEWSASLGGLSDFTDGDYIFTVIYANGKSQSTTIPFEAQDGSPLTVPPRPDMTAPVHGATGVPCYTSFVLDPNNMTNPVWTYGLEYFPTSGSGLEGEFNDLPYTTTTVGPVDLSPNTEYEVELTANHAVWSTNDDGIPYVVDKDSEVEIIFTTASASYLDNFDDNVMGSMWVMMAPNEPNFWLDETSQRLEVRATSSSDDDLALYAPNGWHLDTSQDFGFKIRYHNEVDSATWTELLLALGDPSGNIADNHLQFSVCSLNDGTNNGPHFYYELKQDGLKINDLYETRLSNDGWIYISYDAVLDEVYFGINGYGPTDALKTVSGLLQGDWAGKQIAPHIGGSSDHVEMLSGQAYWDDLIMDYGGIITE